MARFLKNAVIYTTGNVASAAIPFFLLPVLTRVLSPEEYGVIAMFTALAVIFGTLTSLNVHAGVGVQFFQADPPQFSRFIGSCLSIILASSLAIFAIVVLMKPQISAFTSVPESWVLIAVAVAAMNALTQLLLASWTAREKAAAFGLFQFGRTVLEFALSIYLVVYLLKGVDGRLWSYAITALLASAVALFTIARGRTNIRPSRSGIREALAFGVPLVPHTIGLFFMSVGDRFIINALLGTDATGIYTVAAQVGLGMALFMNAFNRALAPYLYGQLKNGSTAILESIAARTWAGFAILLVIAGIVALLSNWIIWIVAGSQFEAAAVPLRWIALGQAFQGMYLLVTNYIFYAKRTGSLAVVTLGCGLAGLLITFLLVPHFGITGAGMSFAIAMLLKFLFTWRLSQRAFPMPWFGVFARAAGSR